MIDRNGHPDSASAAGKHTTEVYHLQKGECLPTSATTKRQWVGPCTVVRTIHADGGREDNGPPEQLRLKGV